MHIAKYVFFIRDKEYENLGDNMVLASEIFSSGCRPRLKNVRAACQAGAYLRFL